MRDRYRHLRLDGRVGARDELHADVAAHRARDARDPLVPASVEDRHGVADAEPQHAREMLAFLTRQEDRLVAWIQRRREKPVHAED